MTAPARAACIIGWPVEHSRSPLIHNYWLKAYGIPGEYRREAVPPDQFRAFVQSLAARGYAGANVTVPHKEAALAWSQPDDRARAVGAANTLWLDGGAALDQYRRRRLFGQSRRLRARLGSRSGQGRRARRRRRGARGGLCAARTRHRPCRGRQPDRSAAPRPCGNASARAFTLPAGTNAMPRSTMRRSSSTRRRSAWPASRNLRSTLGGCPVTPSSPISFTGRWSRRSSARRGPAELRTADGLGMLMHQAVRGFTLWFGKKPEVTAELRALLEADLSLPPASPSE